MPSSTHAMGRGLVIVAAIMAAVLLAVLVLKPMPTTLQEDAAGAFSSTSSSPQSRRGISRPALADVRSSDPSSASNAARKSTMERADWKDYFAKARSEASRAANLIYQRYEFHNFDWYQFFLITWNMPDSAWDILKYKVALKLFENTPQFSVLFTGSSVTVGYDNYFNQSYPSVFTRRIQSVFDALGVDLKVTNLGQHRVDCKLYTYCVPSMADEDRVDVLAWENTYGCGRVRETVEFIARLAARYQAVLYVSASGGLSPQQCAPSQEPISWSSEMWTPPPSLPSLQINASFLASHRKRLHNYYQDSNSVGKFTRFLLRKHRGVGIHGFNMWAQSRRLCKPFWPPASLQPNISGCEASQLFQNMCHDQGGPHFMTQEAALRSLDGQKAKGWNPSAAMQQLRGEILAFNYVLIVLDALELVERDMQQLLPALIIERYQSRLKALQTAIPDKGQYCEEWECSSDNLPRCYTNYQPQRHPRKFSLDSIVLPPHAGWTVDTFKTGYAQDALGYPDTKTYYRGLIGGHPLHLSVAPLHYGVVKLYGLGGKQISLRSVKLILDPHVTDTVPAKEANTGYALSSRAYVLEANVTYNEETDSVHIQGLPVGRHVLTVITPMEASASEASSLTHVVAF